MAVRLFFKKRERHSGFTLLELMVGVSILTLVTGAIVASFAIGVRIWGAAVDVARTEEATRAELAVWGRDIMNARRFRAIPFEGDAHAMTFAVVQPLLDPSRGTAGEVLGSVRYWYDMQSQALYRQTHPFPAPEPWPSHEAERWVDRVDAAVFEYMAMPDPAAAGSLPVWQPTWQDQQQLPLGVRLHLRMTDGAERVRTVIRPERQWQEKDEGL